jgi:hypothetical protein
MRASARTIALAALLASSCTGEQVSSTNGVTEPFRIESGQFIAGALPGLPPPSASEDAGAGVSPQVEDINVGTGVIEQGEEGLTFIPGHASAGAQTVAVRFGDLGTGYWVVPVGGPDPSDGNLPTYQFKADFGRGLPPGFHDLLFAAIDADGSSGTQTSLSMCIDTPVPDNLNICSPKTRAPPAAVLSLSWNTAVDLDLIVQDPSGATVGGNTATTASGVDGGAEPSVSANPSDGILDHIDQEDIVWNSSLQSGTYEVWVDLFSACHQASVSFTVSLWLAEGQPDGTQRLVQQQPPLATGVLTASQANGGSGPGLFVGSFKID